MSETPDSPSSHASLCFDPTLALRQPPLAESEPVTLPSTDATHAETPTTQQTMGNQQSGEGSLRRRSKKKSKKEDKVKVGIASALFSDPVLGATSMGGYGGTSVDDSATPSKRKKQAEQTKSPRPIRSTYDNVNQSGSITSICDASEMYTSDLFLDTVSRLDVSMTPSQAEIAGIRHHIDPQAIDNLSYGGSSLAESGFITPALTTPQVQRNQLAGTMTTSDSVTELGKEIERTIVERLSANQKAGNAEAQSEASVSSSPKSNEAKMTLVMRSPIPPRKAVTEVKLSGASPRTAKLEIIDNNPEDLRGDPESSEPKSLKPLVESKIEIDLGSDQPGLDKNGRKYEVSDGTDKADNELMEKECKTDEMKPVLEKGKNPDDDPGKKVETKDKHKELDVNFTSSSSDENCGDFEKVKLHIEEEDLLVAKDDEKKSTPSRVTVEASVTEAGQVTKIADESSDHNPVPSVAAAGQQSPLVKQDVPEPENVSEEVVVGEKYVQIESTDKEEKTEKTTTTSVGARRRRERPKAETPKEDKEKTVEEKVEKSESVLTSQAPRSQRDEVTETASTGTAVAAAAVVATEPLKSTVRSVVMPKVSEKTDDNASVVDTPEAACEELIQATEFASVEQAQVIMRRPVFQHDDQGLGDIKKAEPETTETGPETKSGPGLNLEPEMDDKNSKNKSEEEPKEAIKEKEGTSVSPNEQKVPAKTNEGLQKEQYLLEAEKATVSTSNTDDIPTTKTTKNKGDPPEEQPADEKPSAGGSEKPTKSKKDRKRKRKRGKQQPADDVTTTQAETIETTSGHEDVAPSSIEVDETVSCKEDTEKSTTDDSGDSSGTVFNKHSLQQQITIIERTGYKKDGDNEKQKEEADDRPVDACDLFLGSEEFRKQETCKTETPESPRSPHQRRENPHVAIETNLTVESPASSEILSDEPTPTNDRSNELRAFYLPDRNQKARAKLFCVADSERNQENESGNDMAEQGDQRDEIQRQSSDSEVKPTGSPPTLEDKNNSENESTKNAVVEDSPEGTKTKSEQKRSLRISLTSEEVSEILQNSQTIFNSRPLGHNQDAEDEVKNIMTGSDRKEDENDENIPDDEGHRKKHTKNISNLTLSDIDSSLPETLPELADLQNFLEYIKIGEQPAEGETPPFSPRGETGRSSPNENSNSRRLSRISPAVTERSVTESDLDISEQRDDLSTDSNIFADDEDESSSELLFTKTYTEPDQGGEVCVSCTVVNTNADEDSDEFWAENSATEEVYRRIETSTKAVTTVFDNARLQMQDIHTHLHNLRLQMENLQDSLDNASIISQEYYNMDNDQVTSQEFYSLEKGLLVSQEYFSRSRKAPVTTEEYSPADIGPVLTEEYYSSTLGKPPML